MPSEPDHPPTPDQPAQSDRPAQSIQPAQPAQSAQPAQPAQSALPVLPPVRGAGLAHVVIPGTALWFVAFVVLLALIPALRAHHQMVWLWTALAGWLLGFVGLAIYGWQRAAARRGSRGSSSMALQETIGRGPSEPAGR